MRRKRERSGSRGAVAVEAALVTPMILVMLFGIIEFAFYLKDDVALTSLVRDGGRIASANAGAGPAGNDNTGACISPCTPANAPMLAQVAADAIQKAGSALPKGSINQLWIYLANAKGYPCLSADTATSHPCVDGTDKNASFNTCATNCVKYQWVPAANRFGYIGGSWNSATIQACAAGPPESVGIYMSATHTFITKIFGASHKLTDHAVFTFEPLATLTCGYGQHL